MPWGGNIRFFLGEKKREVKMSSRRARSSGSAFPQETGDCVSCGREHSLTRSQTALDFSDNLSKSLCAGRYMEKTLILHLVMHLIALMAHAMLNAAAAHQFRLPAIAAFIELAALLVV